MPDQAPGRRVDLGEAEAIAVEDRKRHGTRWEGDGLQHLGQQLGWHQAAAEQRPEEAGQVLEVGHQPAAPAHEGLRAVRSRPCRDPYSVG
jgi:hypothetical protein